MNIIETASKEIGVTAIDGTRSNPRVLEYFKKVGQSWVTDDDTAWCAAFVGFVLETCGIRSTRLLNARSYLTWGVATTKPKQGDVVVFWRDSVSGSLGHVSFFHHEDENTVYCLGGNQLGGKVSIEGYPKSRVLAYRSAIISAPNAPVEHPIKHMEPVTATTPKTIIVKSITVTYDVTENGQTLTTDHPVTVTVTPELIAALKLEDATLVEGGYNVEVVAA